MVSWQGRGRSHWGNLILCETPGHGAVSVFHEIPETKPPVVWFPLLLEKFDASVNNISNVKSSTTTLKRKHDDNSQHDVENTDPEPSQKRSKLDVAAGSDQEHDKENFDDEYAYYAAKIRRLAEEMESQSPPRKHNATSLAPVNEAQPGTTVAKSGITFKFKLPSTNTRAYQTFSAQTDDPQPPRSPSSQGMLPGFSPNKNYEFAIDRLKANPSYRTDTYRPAQTTEQTPKPDGGGDQGDCGCSTILCWHRTGGQERVRRTLRD